MCQLRSYSDDFDFPLPRADARDVDPPNCLHPTSGTWHESTKTRKTKDIREALAYQNQLEAASRNLEHMVASVTAEDAAPLAQHAVPIATATAGLRQFWSKMLATHLYNEVNATAGAARRVFDVPELLERILTFLGRRELLIIQRVDRTMHDAVQESVVLARKLHLVPNATGFLETPFSKSRRYRYRSCPGSCRRRWTSPFHLPGFKCYSMPRVPRSYPGGPDERTEDSDNHRLRTIVATVRPPHKDAPSIGGKCRRMLICNPPVTGMEVYPHCCAYSHYEQDYVYGAHFNWQPGLAPPMPGQVIAPPPPLPLAPPFPAAAAPHLTATVNQPRPDIPPVFNKTGITVGDLLDVAAKLNETHRLCPFASSGHHDADGNVKVAVQFATTVKLKEDDPSVRPITMPPFDPSDPFQTAYHTPLSPSDPASHAATLNRYIMAKRDAHADGRSIPTFEQFKAAETDASGQRGMSTELFAALISSQQRIS